MTDPVRLLGKTSGYTERRDRAMDASEPEAVDAESQRRISEAAREGWPHLNALQTASRESRPLSARIRRIQSQARHLGVDVHPELRRVRLAMEGGRSPEHIERRVAAVEARLWPTVRM
jgi:hypothetical protein